MQRVPSLRRHKNSSRAVVTISGKDYYLGPWPAGASQPPKFVREKYHRLIAEWMANNHRVHPATSAGAGAPAVGLTMNELSLAYMRHRKAMKRQDDDCLIGAIRIIKRLYGDVDASTFGPMALKTCRAAMVELDWSRRYINRQVDRIRQMFKWAVAEELAAETVYRTLMAVPGLRRGEGGREVEPVKPVPQAHVDAALPFMPPMVKAMVEFQLLTGCRPAEACSIRPIDLDNSNPSCWICRLAEHKTRHHGHDRVILIGPRAQEVLKPYLGTKIDGYCFSPLASEQARSVQRRIDRKSPMTPSQAKRRPKRNGRRRPGEKYTTGNYRQAIQRACERAGVPAWAPNQLRHSRATELRKHGLDVLSTILGHSKIETTQIYAEKDLAAAMLLVAQVG